MKKILIVCALLIVILVSQKEGSLVIPDKSFRFRVIANSNSIEDQKEKVIVEESITKYIEDLIKEKKYDEVNKTLLYNKDKIEENVKEILKDNNLKTNFSLNIGRNYFPKKIYKGVTYDAGMYDSLVLTLGKGVGLNWWCVMYPPLCLVDKNKTDIEYTYLVKEIINKYKM